MNPTPYPRGVTGSMKPNRRELLCAFGLALAGGGRAERSESAEAARPAGEVGLPKQWRKMRKFDVHNHVFDPVHRPNANWSRVDNMVEAAESLGIEKLCCSNP